MDHDKSSVAINSYKQNKKKQIGLVAPDLFWK